MNNLNRYFAKNDLFIYHCVTFSYFLNFLNRSTKKLWKTRFAL